MFVVFGEKMYGKVDRVPGLCYVITKFAHLNFVPLFPTGGYIVIKGSESGGDFRGKPIGVSLKSVFVGYVRFWVGLITLISGAVAGGQLFNHANLTPVPPLATGLLLVVALCAVLTLLIPGKVGGAVQLTTHVGSVVLYILFDGAGKGFVAGEVATGQGVLLAANAALLIFGLTRLCDHAGPARRRQLMQELGMEVPPEDAEPRQEDRWEPWDESEDRKRR
ncbi:MAG: hypothetical protein JWO38_3995 [Gemmataceae bacterium]|nr:hypothetical protein [Gemmataceae bacterium]